LNPWPIFTARLVADITHVESAVRRPEAHGDIVREFADEGQVPFDGLPRLRFTWCTTSIVVS